MKVYQKFTHCQTTRVVKRLPWIQKNATKTCALINLRTCLREPPTGQSNRIRAQYFVKFVTQVLNFHELPIWRIMERSEWTVLNVLSFLRSNRNISQIHLESSEKLKSAKNCLREFNWLAWPQQVFLFKVLTEIISQGWRDRGLFSTQLVDIWVGSQGFQIK